MKRCPVCGKKIKAELATCPNCGTNLYLTEGEEDASSRKIHIKKINFNMKQIILVGIIFIASIALLTVKTIKKDYKDEKNIISELMVENFAFRQRVGDIDNNAHEVNDLIIETYDIKDSKLLDNVSSDQKNVNYHGEYVLDENTKLSFDYSGTANKSCQATLEFNKKVADFNEFEQAIVGLDELIANIGNIILTEPISNVTLHEELINFYQKYINNYNEEDLGYVSVGQSYAFVTFNEEDENKTITISFTYDPCEVLF